MQTWVRMALQVAASGPSFDLLNSFSIFDLSSRARRHNQDIDAGQEQSRDEAIDRMAKVFDVDQGKLQCELQDIGPIALQFFTTRKIAVWEAWRMAIHRTQRRACIRVNHPVDALSPVLVRYVAWNGMTSSGVEQTFTKQQRTMLQACRDHMLDEHENDELFLLDVTDCNKAALITPAQDIWACYDGIPRATTGPRLSKGTQRHQAGRGLHAVRESATGHS